MKSIQEISVFYDDLVKHGKDPIYYGKNVTAGDANAILMRWKAVHGRVTLINDFTGSARSADEFIKVEETPSNDYRVVFGDLTIEKVTAEQLKEMERAAHQ
jgi:hypothetical protein